MTTIAERTKFPQVLLIEDNHGDAALMRMAFKKAEMSGSVTVAETAEIGLKMLHREADYAETPCPDIILVDINLPKVSGISFLKAIKADPHLRLIPAIIFSSSSAESDLAETYKSYANGFIVKPFGLDDYAEVVAAIETYWFKLVETPETHDPVTA